jgi:hypothetical protein
MVKNIHFNISEYGNNFWIIASVKESKLWHGTLTVSYDVEYNRYKHLCEWLKPPLC